MMNRKFNRTEIFEVELFRNIVLLNLIYCWIKVFTDLNNNNTNT